MKAMEVTTEAEPIEGIITHTWHIRTKQASIRENSQKSQVRTQRLDFDLDSKRWQPAGPNKWYDSLSLSNIYIYIYIYMYNIIN